MSKRKGNAADLAPSKKEKKGLGQYILGFFLLLYTLFCALPVVLVFIAAFTDEKAINQNGFSFFPEKWSLAGINSVLRYGSQLMTSYGITIFVTVFGIVTVAREVQPLNAAYPIIVLPLAIVTLFNNIQSAKA